MANNGSWFLIQNYDRIIWSTQHYNTNQTGSDRYKLKKLKYDEQNRWMFKKQWKMFYSCVYCRKK